ncbi:MAG TPA: Coq4 family protein [Polyangiaceae bacterium]
MSATMSSSLPLPHFDFRRAGRALAALLRDPDDLPQVFHIIESLSGTAPARLLWGFRRDANGKRLMRDKPDIVRKLADRAWLRTLPAGSLGRAYLEFVEREGISAEGIREASMAERLATAPDVEFMRCRMRDTHDLWHTVTGYQGDVLGELSLLAFTLAQHWNSAIALIVFTGLLRGLGQGHTRVVLEGYRRGRKAAWLPPQDWESMLALPLGDVRARLGVGAPPVYAPVRTSDLRARGVIAAR